MWWPVYALFGYVIGAASGGLAGAVLGGLLGYALVRLRRIEARLQVLETRSAAAVTTPSAETVVDVPEAGPVPVTEPLAAGHGQVAVADAPVLTPLSGLRALITRLLAGNILAKLGVVLLFFGIASGLKLAAEHGVFPPYVRLLGAALAGLLCLGAGLAPATGHAWRPAWLFRFAPDSGPARQGFGFALEGGGFGMLYIATWFACAHYGYLGATAAFALFAGLGIACLVLAARQDSQSFALLGVLGAFLAPVLIPGQGEPRVLFGYLVLLDALVLYLSLYRAWRLLIVTSLAFSVGIGLAWADAAYVEDLRGDVEILVLSLFVLYSVTPWLAARRGAPPRWGWQSGMLLFAPPAAAAAAQSALYYGELGFLALSSLGAGAWYGVLYRLTRRTDATLLGQAQAGLSLTFLSLAPWLAYSQNVAGVFWALEGGAVVWYGMRAGHRLPVLAGSLLQGLSGLLLFDQWTRGPDGMPFRDSLFHASLLLVAAGGLSAYASRAAPFRHRAFLAWSLVWWFAVFHTELARSFNAAQTAVLMLALAAATSAGLEWAGRRYALPDLRAAALILLPALALSLAENYLMTGHPLAHGLWLVMAAALAVHYVGLYRQEADGLTWLLRVRHVLPVWLALPALAWEAAWQFEPFGASVAEAVRALVLASALILFGRAGPAWPFGPHRRDYLLYAMAFPVLLGWLWLFAVPVGLTGAWALPYAPAFNPLEAAALLLLWALYRHWRQADEFGPRALYPALLGLALLFGLSQMLARVVHHWAGVPFLAEALWQSALLQALLSLAWTAYGLVVMVAASRRGLRPVWFAGLGLLLVVCAKLVAVDLASVSGILRVLSLIGVGLLVLGAGYLAPVPPRPGERASP